MSQGKQNQLVSHVHVDFDSELRSYVVQFRSYVVQFTLTESHVGK
jgi:hypothetical protein